jgi:glycerophosphoryl diester phosphodiesterase
VPRATLADLALPPPPIIVGHRGAPGQAPENTLPSFAAAVEQRADMIEFDLHLTADGELVASHDENLMRTAGVDVDIERTPYRDLLEIDVSRYFGSFPKTTMPRMEEALQAIPADLPVNLELKCVAADLELYAVALEERLARGRILVSSFRWELLRVIRRRMPLLPLAPIADKNAPELARIAAELEATSAHCNHETITAAIVERLSRASTPALTYTVNDLAVAERMFAMGVAGVFTNYPGAFVRRFRPS